MPLERARTLHSLGNALRTLGTRGGGTAHLEEAVSAYRTALKDQGRVPLDWTRIKNDLGDALRTLGERESGTARLEEAVAVFRAAMQELDSRAQAV